MICLEMNAGLPLHALCGKLVRCSKVVLGLAGLKPTTEALKKFIRSIPAGEQPKDRPPDLSSFCLSVIAAAESAPLREGQYREFKRAADYLLDISDGMPPRQRRRLVDTTLAVLEVL